MRNPYADLPSTSFWRRSVANIVPFALDPMLSAPFVISKTDKVATAGSCFAQNIAKSLQKSGYIYHIAEEAPSVLTEREAIERNYGVFSARYGNLYTTRQLNQVFRECLGDFVPQLKHWKREDGRFVDPYRPLIEPEGYASAEDVIAARRNHLLMVRRMFETLDVFVFTLGLTEGWRFRADGAVLPLAPGVAGGQWNSEEYEFINFNVNEVTGDLLAFIDGLRAINKNARIILTVSPVPLIATYEKRHVLTATVYSKAVLRVAAEQAARERAGVAYFPSFEIITSPTSGCRYFASDLREVTEAGVRHVMEVFFRHFSDEVKNNSEALRPAWDFKREYIQKSSVVCDEEAITR